MAALLSTKVGELPSSVVLHLDAVGEADRWGEAGVLWRLPLLAIMATVLNVVLAWYLSGVDRFASRFLLAAALVVQLVAWVAIFDFVSL